MTTPSPINGGGTAFVFNPWKHRRSCRFRRAMVAPVPVECEHGYDVCSECDPCTCAMLAERSKPAESGDTNNNINEGD